MRDMRPPRHARIPHRRGGEPLLGDASLTAAGIPHRRGGEPWARSRSAADLGVFPTGVGVNLRVCDTCRRAGGIPHRRGGEPSPQLEVEVWPVYSPQAWG